MKTFHNFCLPRSYVLTLAETPEREQLAMNHLHHELGFDVTPFHGFHGGKMGLSSTKGNVTPGMIGCQLSHLALWKHLLASDDDAFLIFEDDVLLPKGALATMNKAYLMALPSDWDVVYWGYCWRDTSSLLPVNKSFDLAIIPPMCQHAYMIKKTVVRELMPKLDFSLPMDMQTRQLLQRAGKVYAYTDPLFARQGSLIYTNTGDAKVPVVAEDYGVFSSQTCERKCC